MSDDGTGLPDDLGHPLPSRSVGLALGIVSGGILLVGTASAFIYGLTTLA